MPDSKKGFVWDQPAFESLCTELVAAGFSPIIPGSQSRWAGPLPEFLSDLTDAAEMHVVIENGWPVRAARILVPGLVADHVMPSGYICLWADDDPAQALAPTLVDVLGRLSEWAESARNGFTARDHALDAFISFPDRAGRAAELDLPALVGRARNGDIHPVHASASESAVVNVSRAPGESFPLEGVVFYRDRIDRVPRSLDEYLGALTQRQRKNLRHGLQRRANTKENVASGGYDVALLVWPRYGQFETLMLTFSGAGSELVAHANTVSPNDIESRLRRAGPDALELRGKRVLVAGVGSVGGQVALTLASSGVGELQLHDGDVMKSVNLVRHVSDTYTVGFPKTFGLANRIGGSAPWCAVKCEPELPASVTEVADIVDGFDLVIDCTGTYFVSVTLAQACADRGVPLVAVSLFRQGRVFRVRRQDVGDVPILERGTGTGFVPIPAGDPTDFDGFIELGCTAPVNNAPPANVIRAAADTALVSLDTLMGRRTYGQEHVTTLAALTEPPFDVVGTLEFPTRDSTSGTL